jgi:BASS family bile acid:Na+ symporter
MDARQLVVFVIQGSILLTVFGFGLQATRAEVFEVLRRPAPLLRSLAAMFIVMPILTLLMVRAVDFHPAVKIALVSLAISPVPPLLPNRELKAGGRFSYGIGLMATAAVLSIAFIPLAVRVLGLVIGQPIAMGSGAVARAVLGFIILPLGAGMLVKRWAPFVADALARPAAVLAILGLVAGAVAILAAMLPTALSLVGNGTIAGLVAFVVIGLVVGHVLGGRDRDERAVLALSTACRHPAIAMAIARANFPGEDLVPSAVLLYLLVNIVFALPYIVVLRRTAATPSPAAHV